MEQELFLVWPLQQLANPWLENGKAVLTEELSLWSDKALTINKLPGCPWVGVGLGCSIMVTARATQGTCAQREGGTQRGCMGCLIA